MVSQLTLFVFIIGSQDSCFHVKIENSETVGDLKDSILEEGKNSLKSVNADRLVLYQVELPDGETLGALAAQAVKERKELSPSTPLFEIFPTHPPEETISILVRISDVIRDDGTALAIYDKLVDSGLIAYQSIFIKIKSRGKFGDADLDRNCIYKKYNSSWDDGPDHVKRFGEMLDSKPGLDLNVRCFLRISL
ncbi:hypothetical protein BC827DRAFT_419595 [Russula dissimulans]|nr:hypothetical protein BC827DRAFT_419595 [Russula dissimulans]